jgi:hypothetical protein
MKQGELLGQLPTMSPRLADILRGSFDIATFTEIKNWRGNRNIFKLAVVLLLFGLSNHTTCSQTKTCAAVHLINVTQNA